MALALLRNGLRAGLLSAASAATVTVSRSSLKMVAPRMFTTSRPSYMAAAKGERAPPAAEPVDVEVDEDELGEYGEQMPATMQRRVMALRELQAEYDKLMTSYQRELAQLQASYLQKAAPLFQQRKAIVLGEKEVAKFDIEDDDLGDEKCIPEFWVMAFMNHDKVGPYITERDAEVLKNLTDVRVEVLTGEERGFKLFFDFKDNEFFTNKTLEKTYILEPEEDIVPKAFVGCKIDWKSPSVDPTVEQKKKRVKSGKEGSKGSKPSFVMETVPCESFFNFFDPPEVPKSAEDMQPDELDALQEELSTDFDIGFAIKEGIIPRAVEWFTGELTPEDEEDYYDEEEAEEYEEEPPPPPAQLKKRQR